MAPLSGPIRVLNIRKRADSALGGMHPGPRTVDGSVGTRVIPWASSPEGVAFVQRRGVVSLFSFCCLVAVVACVGCSPKGASSPATDPQRQSEAQYDVARDYFEKGEPRLALDHCRNAIELDPDNA